jgi:integrase
VKPKKLVVVRYRQDRQKWECDYSFPTPTGTKRLRPLFDDESGAVAHASEITKKLNDGLPIITVGRDIMLKDYAPQWLQARDGIIAARTLRCYDQCLRGYVLPKLGALRIRDLKVGHLLPWLTHLKARGLSPNSIRLARAALSAVLGHAVLEGVVDDNVMMYLSKQKTRRPGKLTKADHQVRPFDAEQLQRFLAVARQPRYQPYGACWTLMAGGGLRPGEAFAVKPGDLDLTAKTLQVQRALDMG